MSKGVWKPSFSTVVTFVCFGFGSLVTITRGLLSRIILLHIYVCYYWRTRCTCVTGVITRAIQQKNYKELERWFKVLKSFKKVLSLIFFSMNRRMVSPHRANMAWRLKQVLMDGLACPLSRSGVSPLSRSGVSLLSRNKNYGSLWNRNIGFRPCVSGLRLHRILGLHLHTYSAVLMQRNKTGSENSSSGGNQKEKLLPSGLITTPQNIQVRNARTIIHLGLQKQSKLRIKTNRCCILKLIFF